MNNGKEGERKEVQWKYKSIAKISFTKQGIMPHAYNPSSREIEVVGSKVWGQSGYIVISYLFNNYF
jgi:hypothetical protein